MPEMMFGVLAAELLFVTRSSGVKLGGSFSAMIRGMTTEGVFAILDALGGESSTIRLFSSPF